MNKKKIFLHTMMAIPFKSEEALAAVADVFGTLSVAVSIMCILSGFIFNDLLAT